ncbi:MAG: tetratricopeptide repeat protein [Anaerolineae bacterium]|nr:tetratricopeptide repeat protein [Anaerolineae bacterium]
MQPYISPDAVHASLKRMTFGVRQREQMNPLDHLYLVERQIEDRDAPRGSALREIAVARVLVRLIRRSLDAYCHLLKAPALRDDTNRAEALHDLQWVGQMDHTALKHWALLYFRYVRADLELDTPHFCAQLNIDERTFRRYQSAALHRLTVALTKAEWQARRKARHRRLIAALPGQTGMHLFGREPQLNQALHWLSVGPQKLLVSGSLGVGKTRFVHALVEELITADRVDDVIWLNTPASVQAVDLRLREHAAVRGVLDFDLREHLLASRLVVIIDGIGDLLDDTQALDGLLCDLEAAHVILIADQYVLLPAVTVSLTLAPLDWKDTHALAAYWWQQLQGDPAVSSEELEALANASYGNPLSLNLMIHGYGHMVDETLNQVSTRSLYEQTTARLSAEARGLWHIMALTPPEGIALARLRALWGSRVDAPVVDELLLRHIIAIKQPDVCYLIDFAQAWIVRDYQSGGEARQPVDQLIEELDALVTAGDAVAQELAEYLLIARWLDLAQDRREAWIAASWRAGVRRNHWAAWLELLRDALAANNQITAFWIGRGVCARWLSIWDESEAALRQAMHLSGMAGGPEGFMVQAEAEIELSVTYRLRGQYERALALLEQAQGQAERWNSEFLAARALLEHAQILLDQGDSEDALTLLARAQPSARRYLMEGEAWLQLQRPADCQQAAQAALPFLADDRSGIGKVYGQLARAAQALGEREQANAYYTQAVALLDQTGDQYSLARVYSNQALLWMDEQRYDQAYELLERCEALQRGLGDHVALFTTRHNLQLVRQRMNR